jgi:drug/metabolite transporter (DMT)-like permease
VYSDLLMLLASLVWGLAFIPQRMATGHIGFFLFNGLRFLLGALVLVPILWWRPKPDRKLIAWAAAAGSVLVAAAALQQAGLKYTTAGNAGFLTGLYVILVPVVLLIGWRQPMSWRSWAAALLAAAGAFLLSADSTLQLNFGDCLEVIGAVLWALHIVLVGRAVAQFDVLWFSVSQYLVAGTISTLLGLGLESHTLPGLTVCWWAIGYTGIFSIGVGYTLQAVGQRHAPAADAAVILSMEAVFAALFGFMLLGESLIARQYVGCALILGAVIFVQIRPSAPLAPSPQGNR